MKRGTMLAVTGVAIVAAVTAVVLLTRGPGASRTPDADAPVAATVASDVASTDTTTGGLTASATKVDADARWLRDADGTQGNRLQVTLRIADGWKVNATPASLDFLIPTRISGTVDGNAVELVPNYPIGAKSDIELEGTRIRVYRDGTTIDVGVPAATAERAQSAGGLELTVRVQSCSDDGICLAPSDLQASAQLGTED